MTGQTGRMTTGEFSRRSQLSIKALRLYDQLGLLLPAAVDGHNGYRGYDESQLFTARLIVLLRSLDMPLQEVARVVARSTLGRLVPGGRQRTGHSGGDQTRKPISSAGQFGHLGQPAEPRDAIGSTTAGAVHLLARTVASGGIRSWCA